MGMGYPSGPSAIKIWEHLFRNFLIQFVVGDISPVLYLYCPFWREIAVREVW